MDLKNYFTSNKNGSLLKEKSLKNINKELYFKIINYGVENNINTPFKELVWLYVNNVNMVPECKICNNTTKFQTFGSGYRTYCSKECKSKDVDVKDLVKQTFQKKYGGHPMQNEEIKNKVKKTNIEKYGVDYHLKSDFIKNKIESTNIEKYGVKRPLQSDLILNKTKKTMLDRYEVEHGLQSKEIHNKTVDSLIKNNDWGVIVDKTKNTKLDRYGDKNYCNKEKVKETMLQRYGEENPSTVKEFLNKRNETKLINSIKKYKHGDKIIINSFNDVECDITCKVCNTNTIINRHNLVMRGNSNRIICLNCNPYNSHKSSYESELFEFLNQNGINCDIGDRKILNGLELDIFIPSHNLAIEFNGLYWHNEIYCDKYYHLNKTKLCQKQGITLLHIFEDEWIFGKEKILSIIKNKLKLKQDVIYARNCIIKTPSIKEEKEFLNKNHIQGYTPSGIKLGLYHNDNLVSLMTFGGLRKVLGFKNKKDCYEMLRFCNKLNTNVVGGASKLFKFFIKNNNVGEVLSYSDNRYFNGNLYEKLGFKFVGETKPNYFYTKGFKREHRFKYRKDVLVKQGYNPNKTEHQIMLERKIYRIYDCGNKKWIFLK